MQTFYEILQLMMMFGIIGFIISIILIITFFLSKSASSAAKTFLIGSVAAFLIGGQYIGIPSIVFITWGNVIGLVGGYLCIILAIVQYFFDRRKSSIQNV